NAPLTHVEPGTRETAIHPNGPLTKVTRALTLNRLSSDECFVSARTLSVRVFRHLRQEHRPQPQRRQVRTDLIDMPSTAAPRPPMPKATPKNTPDIIPKRCGISSCANTMIEDVADERMRPMNTVSTALAARPA